MCAFIRIVFFRGFGETIQLRENGQNKNGIRPAKITNKLKKKKKTEK